MEMHSQAESSSKYPVKERSRSIHAAYITPHDMVLPIGIRVKLGDKTHCQWHRPGQPGHSKDPLHIAEKSWQGVIRAWMKASRSFPEKLKEVDIGNR